MPKTSELLNRIQTNLKDYSKGHRTIGQYIIENCDKAAFMTAKVLGDTVGVSEATVVRFATKIGYEGYPGFQKALRELIKSKLTAAQRIQASQYKDDSTEILKQVLKADINNIKMTLAEIDKEEFNDIVEMLRGGKRVFILGVRSSGALAAFLGFYFNLIFDNIRIVNTASVSEMFEQIINVNSNDVVIGISFPRYSRRTAKAMQFVRNKGAKVIAITDSFESPISTYAHKSLIAKSDMASFVDSLAAPLSVINALIVAVGSKNEEKIARTFKKLEHIWDEYQVYQKDETIFSSVDIDHDKV